MFYSIFQFTGCFGTAIGGVIKQLTDDNRVLFTVLTVVGALAVASMFILPSVKAYTAPGHSENEDVALNRTAMKGRRCRSTPRCVCCASR